MTFENLITEVQFLTKDEGYFDYIPGYINAIYIKSCLDAKFPELKTIATVDTTVSQMTTSLSKTFGQIKPLDKTIKYYDNLDTMIEGLDTEALAETGAVQRCCTMGSLLWYWPTPITAQTLTFLGYAAPEPLTANDEPLYIPELLQYRILVHGASKYVFAKIEDGIDGQKVNTLWSEDEYKKGMLDLFAHIGRNRNHITSSVWRV